MTITKDTGREVQGAYDIGYQRTTPVALVRALLEEALIVFIAHGLIAERC